MNVFKRVFAAGTIVAVTAAGFLPIAVNAHAPHHGLQHHKYEHHRVAKLQTGSMEQVNESGFGDSANTAVRLYKTENGVYGITDNVNGIQLWSANEDGSTWTQVTDSALTIDTTATSVVGFARYPHVVFVTVATPDGFEVWRKSRNADWTKVYEQKGEDTSAVSFGRFNKRVYVSVASNSTEGQARVFLSGVRGTEWTQLSTTGFDNAVNAVDSIVEYKNDIYVTTDDGRMLRQDGEVWSTAYEAAEGYGHITELRKVRGMALIAAVEGPNGAEIMRSTDGTTWETVVSNGMENADNARVSKIMVVDRWIYAFVENSVGGAEIWSAKRADLSDWSMYQDAGLGDIENTAIHFVVKIGGKTFYPTTNSVDGAQVIRGERS